MPRISKFKEESDADRLARYGRIVQAFHDAGLATTQTDIGAMLVPPVGQGAVSAWKKHNPSIGHLVQIVKLTGVSGHWLLTGEGPREAAAFERADNALQSLVDALSDGAKAALVERIERNRKAGE